MTNKEQSTERPIKAGSPEARAAGITSLARIRRSLRKVAEVQARYEGIDVTDVMARSSVVFGPLTAEQAKFEEDIAAEIIRQDANPEAYDIPYTPEEMSAVFNVPLEICRGLGTES